MAASASAALYFPRQSGIVNPIAPAQALRPSSGFEVVPEPISKYSNISVKSGQLFFFANSMLFSFFRIKCWACLSSGRPAWARAQSSVRLSAKCASPTSLTRPKIESDGLFKRALSLASTAFFPCSSVKIVSDNREISRCVLRTSC
jgi:hypothetical protein